MNIPKTMIMKMTRVPLKRDVFVVRGRGGKGGGGGGNDEYFCHEYDIIPYLLFNIYLKFLGENKCNFNI